MEVARVGQCHERLRWSQAPSPGLRDSEGQGDGVPGASSLQ